MKNLVHQYTVVERIARGAGIVLAIIIYLVRGSSLKIHPILFLFGLLISVSFTALFARETSASIERRPFIATVDALCALVLAMFTQGASSPFMFYFFAVIVSLARLLPPLSAMFYAAVMMVFLLSDILARAPRAFSQNLFVLLPSLAGLTILTGIVSYMVNRLEEVTAPAAPAAEEATVQAPEPEASEEAEPATQETAREASTSEPADLVDQLWDVIDFLRDLDRAHSIETCARSFLLFLSRHEVVPMFALHLKKDVLLDLFTLANEDVAVHELKGYIDPETRSLGDEIRIPLEDGKKFVLSLVTSTPETAIYLDIASLPSDPFAQAVVRLAAELATFKIAELVLQTKEAILLSRFSSLYNAATEVGGTFDRRTVLESAASAIKGLTGMEKVVVMLASSPDDVALDFSRTVVKGSVVEHPEQFWRNPLLAAGKKCLVDCSPVVSSVEGTTSHMVCVPIRFRNRVLGLIAGLTSLSPEEILGDLKTLEVIAALVATTLANIELLEEREAEAVASEKDRIARDMYHTLVGALYQLLIDTENALHALRSRSPEALTGLLSLREEVRNLARTTREYAYSIYPEARSALGIRTALTRLVESYDREGRVALHIDDSLPVLPIELEHAILKITQEGLSNALHHAQASHISLSLERSDDQVILTITDDGVGFSPREALEKIKEERKVGIHSMFDAARSVGGNLQISSRPGAGATVRAVFSLEPSAEERSEEKKTGATGAADAP
jgi:signal transduction histidine kinase